MWGEEGEGKIIKHSIYIRMGKKKFPLKLRPEQFGVCCLNVIPLLDAVYSFNRNKVWIAGLGSSVECYIWFAFCMVCAWPWEMEERHAKRDVAVSKPLSHIQPKHHPVGSGVPRLPRGFTPSLSLQGSPKSGDASAFSGSSMHPNINMYPNTRW